MIPDDRHLAAVFLLRFYMNRTRKKYSDIARDAGIPAAEVARKGVGVIKEKGKHVNNFHDTFQSQHFEKICGFLYKKIDSDDVFQHRSAVINGLIETLCGQPTRHKQTQDVSFDRLLSPIVEEGDDWKQRLVTAYGSAWHVIRFAVGAGPGMDKRKNRNDPWMIYAIMNIHPSEGKEANGFPAFKILYKPLRDSGKSFRPINGSVLSFKEGPYMMFFGVEEGTKWPLIVAADQQKDINARPEAFKSFTLRKFESGSFIAGYSLFLRSNMPWDKLVAHRVLGNVGIFRRSQIVQRLKRLEPKIGAKINGLRNVAENNGRSMLLL